MDVPSTYEATRARESNSRRPDRIHWEKDAAYRDQNYRHLDHQRGVIGHFDVRLLEAAELRRSHWSALALGPVRLLGLSKAHGAVSSFCTVSLSYGASAWQQQQQQQQRRRSAIERRRLSSSSSFDRDSKPHARLSVSSSSSSSALQRNNKERYVSPVVPEDDYPVWNDCHFSIPLKKGALQDGERIHLNVRMDEDSTAVENMIPGGPSGEDSRLLGTGAIDITSLCMGTHPLTGQPQVNVLDTWIPIQMRKPEDADGYHDEDDEYSDDLKKMKLRDDDDDDNPKKQNSSSPSSTGRVRVLVSYKPFGMEPREHDIVAFEAFARRNPYDRSCMPILSPNAPMRVKQKSGSWLLVEYQMSLFDNTASMIRRRQQHHGWLSFGGDNDGDYSSHRPQKACIRIHRNTVFVIERKNILDETINLALLPADVFLSTPIGKSTWQFTKPLVLASKQLFMPALLSAKLVWMAVRTTTVASLTGVSAATSTMWNEGSTQLTTDEDEHHNENESMQQLAAPTSYKFISL